MLIRKLGPHDLDPFVEHIVRHMGENRTDGGPVFAPFAELPRTPEEIRAKNETGWRADVGGEGWMRTWGAFTEEGRLVAHADLRARGGGPTGHRTLLGMGVTKPYRRRGLGTRLLQVVAAWAKEEGFVWLDLFTLEPNLPAQGLYASFGFQEVSRYQDFFRIAGEPVGDIGMTLDLREWSPP